MPTATIQMKNSAIDSTSEIFRADQVSMCRSCSRARRGPRPPLADPRGVLRAAVRSDARSAGRAAPEVGEATGAAGVEAAGVEAPIAEAPETGALVAVRPVGEP